jgi:hypothetical protein
MPSRCQQCNREFATRPAYLQHRRAAHGIEIRAVPASRGGGRGRRGRGRGEDRVAALIEKLPAPVDVEGFWTPRDQFRGIKSFGTFQCECGKIWKSAHAQPKFKQGCQRCEKERLPDVLWVNVGDREDRPSDDESPDDDEAPHDHRRCGACRVGACTAQGGLNYALDY